MSWITAVRSDGTGTRYWRRGEDGEKIEITEKEYNQLSWWPPTIIHDQLAADLGVCLNCLCSDCGCCGGCGQPDADLFGSHGYFEYGGGCV